MAEALERHLADDRDRRRVQEVDDLGARERAAGEDPALAIDEEARCPARPGCRKEPPRLPEVSVS